MPSPRPARSRARGRRAPGAGTADASRPAARPGSARSRRSTRWSGRSTAGRRRPGAAWWRRSARCSPSAAGRCWPPRRRTSSPRSPLDAAALLPRVRVSGLAAAGAWQLDRVINATGVVLHTNLGPRAARSGGARAARPRRRALLEPRARRPRRRRAAPATTTWTRLLCRLSGAEASLVVNNNAAAVLLALESLARGREVVVSRGELIEIGGAFRIPDILARSGARLVEVGTTNRTRLADYASAISAETGAAPQGPPLELPGGRLHGGRRDGGAGGARPRARHSGARGPRLGLLRGPPAVGASARADRARDGRGGRRRRHVLRRQAARRPAGRHRRRPAARSWSGCGRTRSTGRSGSTS